MPPSVTPGEKPKRSPWDLSREDLAEELSGEPRFRLDQIWHGLYDTGAPPDQISTIPVALRTRLSEAHPPALRTITEQRSKSGDTIKWLFALPDGAQIETVLMHYKDRSTACVSSQAGCAMACSFCATGQAGFERHLSAGEILEQIILAREAALPNRLSNVVFMGMGEPLANLSRLTEAIDRVTADMGIGARRITVSTVGLIPAMIRFAELKSQVGLAVSLHAANDDLRTELVPINKRYPISDLVEACLQVRALTTRRVSFEWAMINGVNDRDSDVAELAAVAKQARAHVNLIPLNPTPVIQLSARAHNGSELSPRSFGTLASTQPSGQIWVPTSTLPADSSPQGTQTELRLFEPSLHVSPGVGVENGCEQRCGKHH